MSATSDTWVIPTPSDDATPLDAWIARAALQGEFLVADTSERADLLVALAAAGYDDTYVRVVRLDADEGEEREYTVDGGTTWQVLLAMTQEDDGSGWSPSYSGLTVGNSVITTRVTRRNGWVWGYWNMILGSTGSVTGSINVSLPETALAGLESIGTARLSDSSASGNSSRDLAMVSTTSGQTNFVMIDYNGAIVATADPFTWATGDQIGATFAYPYV